MIIFLFMYVIAPKSFLSMETSKDQLDELSDDNIEEDNITELYELSDDNITELMRKIFINEFHQVNHFVTRLDQLRNYRSYILHDKDRIKYMINYLIYTGYFLIKKLKDNGKQRFNMMQMFNISRKTLGIINKKSNELRDKIMQIIKEIKKPLNPFSELEQLHMCILFELVNSISLNMYDISLNFINQLEDSPSKEDKKQLTQIEVLKFKFATVNRLFFILVSLIENYQITEKKYTIDEKEYSVLEITTVIKLAIKEELTDIIPKIVQEAISKYQLDQYPKKLLIKQLFHLSSTLKIKKLFDLSFILNQKYLYENYMCEIIMKVIEILQTAEKNLQIETDLQIQINQLIHQFTITLEDVKQLENCTTLEIRDKRSINIIVIDLNI